MAISTSDPKEMARFNALAATWWDSNGPMWPLHKLNQFRVQVILDILHEQSTINKHSEQPFSGQHILDVGCGGGILSESLAALGANVTGIDTAKNNILIAQQHAADNNLPIHYQHIEVAELNTQYDMVFNMEVVEHVTDLPKFMRHCNSRVKSGGTLFLSTINRTLKSYLIAILGAEYILQLLPRGTHQWNKFVAPETLGKMLEEDNLAPFWCNGVSLNPITKQFKLARSLAVSYMMAAHKTE
jgi:2-polyprenyl-6-hydroxyphenyl methylase/3-demethylubiquinone-9 3-methyltransferase